MRKVILYVPIVGGVVVGISVLMAQIGTLTLTDDFLAGPRTVAAAVNAENDFLLWSNALFQLGSLTLAVGLVLVSLNAMRVGILTRLMGYIGIVAGAMLVLFPLPVVQIFWMGALAVLFFGRWPGGDPPAWRTGKAEPWEPRVASAPRPQTARGSASAPQAKEASLGRTTRWRPKVRRSSSSWRSFWIRRRSLLRRTSRSRRSSPIPRSTSRPRNTRTSGPSGPRRSTGTRSGTQVLDWSNPPFAKWFVGGKLNVSYNCVDRHVEAGNGDRVAYHWRGEEGEELDVTYADLHRDVQKLANGLKEAGRQKGRRRRDLPADDPRGRGGDARLRADRRDPQRRLRRLQRRVGQGADRVLRGEDADHRRRRPPQGQDGADQGAGRRGDRRPRGHDRRRQARRQRRADEGRPRPRLPGAARQGRRRVPGRADGRRGPALHPLHERLDGEAEGHPAHDRRLPDRRRLHARGGVRPQARGGHLLVRGRRRLGHRPQLHRLRAAGQRHDVGDVGGRAGLPGQGRVVGHRRALQGDDPLLRADRDPRVHEVGRRAPRGP